MTRSERWLALIQTLRIRRRDRRIAPLTLNYPQQKIWNVIAPMIDRGEPIRVIILKARRQGVSTLAEAILTAFCAESDHVNALVTAHDKKPAAKIWGIAKRYVTTSKILRAVTTIGKDASGSDIIRFGDSTLEVSTAGSPEKERGTDLTAWHGSEVAQYPFASIMTATMQALPDDPSVFSIAILESTANGKVGKGRLFYKEWLRAQRGESEWTPIFIAWHEHPEYSIPDAPRIDDATPEEQALRLRFELTDRQLWWRRRKIARDLEGDADKFRVEYPSYPEEAFITSGLPFFRPAQLLPLEGDLCKGTRYTIDTEGRLTPEPKGYLEIWKMPEPGRRYIVGSDSAMGLDDEIDDEDGDGRAGSHSRSAGEVIDMETLEQVAEYDAPSAPHIMARHLAGIGRLYNNALLAPEVQSSGGGGGRELLVYLHELAYWNIHQASQNQDRVQPKPKIRIGWECVDPDARILTMDLQWVPARHVKVGDRLIGCQERPPGGQGVENGLRVQTVVERRVFVAPMVEVVLEDGRRTKVSTNHPFWVGRPSPRAGKHQRVWRWIIASEVRPGDAVRGLQVWDTLRTYDAGRLSGLLDGEGHLSQGRLHGLQMLISQAEGPLAEEISDLWSDLGFSTKFKWVRHKRPHEKPVATCGPIRVSHVFHALGSLRPTRLLRKFAEKIDISRYTIRVLPTAVVAEVQAIGDGPVVGLTTDPDHTLIADGILGHNTNHRTRPRMLARIREVVMEQSAVIHSRRLFDQLSSFGENDAGRKVALAGHDDLLFAFGIALMSRSENYFKKPASQSASAPSINWKALGIRVVGPGLQMNGAEFIQRQIAMASRREHGRTFLEM